MRQLRLQPAGDQLQAEAARTTPMGQKTTWGFQKPTAATAQEERARRCWNHQDACQDPRRAHRGVGEADTGAGERLWDWESQIRGGRRRTAGRTVDAASRQYYMDRTALQQARGDLPLVHERSLREWRPVQ